jgi:hypothetical protein
MTLIYLIEHYETFATGLSSLRQEPKRPIFLRQFKVLIFRKISYVRAVLTVLRDIFPHQNCVHIFLLPHELHDCVWVTHLSIKMLYTFYELHINFSVTHFLIKILYTFLLPYKLHTYSILFYFYTGCTGSNESSIETQS